MLLGEVQLLSLRVTQILEKPRVRVKDSELYISGLIHGSNRLDRLLDLISDRLARGRADGS